MAFLNDEVFDAGLDYAVSTIAQVDICAAEPATYAGLAAVTLGTSAITAGVPQDGAVDGRRIVLPAITAGSVTATGTATHWALTDGLGILIATGSLSASQAVTSGNLFTLAAFSITFRDAVNEV